MLLLCALAGCGKTATPTKSEGGGKTEAAKADPWESVAKKLRKDTDAGACRTALSQLNSDLANRPDVPGPAPLGGDAEKALAALVPLSPPDLAEVKSASFSSLDPVYLAECLYLRDAARTAAPPTAPPSKAADLAFAFVCRQVYVNPWLFDGQLVPAVPPTYVLRRGHGSGLERAYVFLALLQQMGIDGCLIGPPDAADKPSGFAPLGPDGKPRGPIPTGPFWAVGARVGADIQVYEPWRGERFPGNLGQLKANPDPLKPWFDSKTWPVTPDDVKAASVFLAVPVSALAPRMAVLEDKLKGESGVKLSVGAAALRGRFLAEAVKGPSFPNAEVKFWNPPADRYAYGRALPTFLPLEEGGLDRAEQAARIHSFYHLAMLPRAVLALPEEIKEAAVRERLVSAAAATYERAFFTPPSPRERIQRGQFQEAARYLAARQDTFMKGLERLRNNRDAAQTAEFIRVANEVHANLSRAQSFDQGAVPAAQAAVNDFWNRYGPVAQLVVDGASAKAGHLESSFLLALCKHEEAEREQARSELATGADADRLRQDAAAAWREANNTWDSYRAIAGESPGFPGRAAHVKALAERAGALDAAKK